MWALELVGLQPDIILTATIAATVALQRETRTIPIVFVSAVDPVASGIVPRLDRPGGNATGFALFEDTLGGKSGASATLAPWLTPRNRGGLAPWQLRRYSIISKRTWPTTCHWRSGKFSGNSPTMERTMALRC